MAPMPVTSRRIAAHRDAPRYARLWYTAAGWWRPTCIIRSDNSALVNVRRIVSKRRPSRICITGSRRLGRSEKSHLVAAGATGNLLKMIKSSDFERHAYLIEETETEPHAQIDRFFNALPTKRIIWRKCRRIEIIIWQAFKFLSNLKASNEIFIEVKAKWSEFP